MVRRGSTVRVRQRACSSIPSPIVRPGRPLKVQRHEDDRGRRETSGARDRVWGLLADGSAWTQWGSWSENERSTYEHAGPLTALMLRAAVKDACKRLAKAASSKE